jgi:hypothetical protein
MTREQRLAQALAEIENILDCNESISDDLAEDMWTIIHEPEVWTSILEVVAESESAIS